MSRVHLTVAVEEELLLEARAVAARRRTSVNEMVCQFLRQVVGQEDRRSAAFERIQHLLEAPPMTLGGPLPLPSRDELHER